MHFNRQKESVKEPYIIARAFIKLLLLFSVILSSCGKIQNGFIGFNDDRIEYEGRIGMDYSTAAEIYWPGSSIKIYFEGTSLKAMLEDERGKNYFNIIIDDDSIQILKLDTAKRFYNIAENLPEGKHSVEIFKRTEWNKGKTWFYGFDLGKENKILDPPAAKNHMIEFYGNSITAGYAIEDFSGDSPDSIYTNNYLTYGALTARHYNAKYSCVVRSGIGLMVSWFPLIMPELFNRVDPKNPLSLWDFSKETPNIVVINLLQNDFYLVKSTKREEYKYRFGTNPPPTEDFIIDSYKSFVQLIRDEYPEAHIICVLGSLSITKKGSPWPAYVEKAVASLGDDRIYTHLFPYINKLGHPEVEHHKKMSESLIQFIDKHIEW
ncbi:MAG: electron transporter RnfD [Bacteroidetes bacterium]|nr:MAG: electron transporter RnfD [Bacteroidota bacterium]